ncbi:MAG: type III-B CRISPR module-associated Cmr3 family protein [Amphritea sp.]
MMHFDCRFDIADSWFFREARAHDAIGVGQLDSVFPPPVSTLAGALRTTLGDQLGVDWQAFRHGEASPEHHELLGNGNDLGALSIQGPFLSESAAGQPPQLLYPAPAALMKSTRVQGDDSEIELHRLRIGTPVRSDLGRVALPELSPQTPAGSKPLEQCWITEQGLKDWLSGKTPDTSELRMMQDLIKAESRLGIGRNNQRATVKEGQLYQTRHIRIRQPGLGISLQLTGVPTALTGQLDSTQLGVRLGGEGREASLSLSTTDQSWQPPSAKACDAAGLLLTLITPAHLTDDMTQTPLPGFIPIRDSQGHICHWEGELRGIGLRLISAVMPRMLRMGGWDQQKHAPKPLRSLVTPGTVFYCQLLDTVQPINAAVKALNGIQIGEQQAFGFGLLAAGYWPALEFAQG